ncbi:MAG: hypothetical protein H6747_12000 [Deltaproteobacteria bacterium]|nr:hypothetical protein [Deltaproteobacteria bacterium]
MRAAALALTAVLTLPASLWADAPPPPEEPGAEELTEAERKARDDAEAAAAEKAKAAAAEKAPDGALTPETIAIAEPPKGFRYSVLRDVQIDEVAANYLYVKASKTAQSTRAVPIPKDRELLKGCIAGGVPDDLQRGAVVTVKFDPKGVVRPEIVLQTKVEIEELKGIKVIDRGGTKLYVTTPDGGQRGFAIEGDPSGWNDVVEGGDASGLLGGAVIDLRFDPSGREPLKIKIVTPSPKAERAKPEAGGCGCSVRGGGSSPTAGALGLLLLCLAGLLLRRRIAAA